MQKTAKSAILLLAHGTPDVLSDMAPYLDKVTGGRPMPQHVVEELQHRYAEIGLRETPLPEGPPLTRWTLLQGKLLRQLLSSAEQEQSVYVGMRNWHPYIADTVAQMVADGVTHARVLCLAPQNSRTSTGLYRRALMEAVRDQFTVEFIAGWADEPLLALAFAQRMWPAWAEACAVTGTRVPILFTAHAVPCRTIMSGAVSTPASPSAAPGAPVPENGIQHYGSASRPTLTPSSASRLRSALLLRWRLSGFVTTAGSSPSRVRGSQGLRG